jgi:metallo-beta-lactamase class B
MRPVPLAIVLAIALPIAARPAPARAQTVSNMRASIHGAWSAAVEPFRVIGNVYYVGARQIASYLIVTPAGHILLDTGTKEMEPVVRRNIEKLGFKLTDIKILLCGHAHYDHVQGHAAMKRATGARVMALGDDALALASGRDRSPLADEERWDPVPVDRTLKDRDTVTLGGTTLKATWAPGHTPGCTVWSTRVDDQHQPRTLAFFACAGPNADVKLVGNRKFPRLVDETREGLRRLRALHPDLYVTMHPDANERPITHDDWTKMLDEIDADLTHRVRAEEAAQRP